MLTMTCLYADYKCGCVRVFWFFSSIHNLLSTFLLLLIFGFNCRLFIIPRKNLTIKKNVQELYCLYINVRREKKNSFCFRNHMHYVLDMANFVYGKNKAIVRCSDRDDLTRKRVARVHRPKRQEPNGLDLAGIRKILHHLSNQR